MARLSRVNRHALPAPSRGGGRRPRSGREVGVVYEHRSTAETGRQGGESSTPLPVSPSPTGRFPHRYGATESIPSPGFSSGENLPANSTPLPCARLSCQSPCTARLISQGGWSMNTVQSEMQETGEGDLPPPSPSAPPPWGRFPHRYTATECIPSPGFSSGENLPANSTPLPLWHGYPGSIAMHCPPPLEGAGGGRGAAGRWGGSMNSVQRLRRETGEGDVPPPPRQPLPRGRFPHRYGATESIPSPGFRREPHRRSCLSPCARPSCQSPNTARLISQGGWSMNSVQSEMQETGAGNVPSPSPSAPPQGAIPPSIHCNGSASTHPVSGENLTEDPVSPPVHGHRANRQTLARPPSQVPGRSGTSRSLV